MTTLAVRPIPGRLLVLAAVALVASGCFAGGVKKVTVHGTISYQGQPLRSGLLGFSGPEGAYSAGSIRPDGTFTVTDVVPGEVKVAVLEAPRGSKVGASNQQDPSGFLPPQYRDPETSGLRYTITPQTRELPIEIK